MDTSTALTFVLPNEVHDKINEIRSVSDKAYPRWMPHINFIFPFVPPTEFSSVAEKLKDLEFSPFKVVFDSIGYFSQGKNVTFHLKPNAESTKFLKEVFDKIRSRIPDVPVKHAEFTPHVTIAQCPKNMLHATLSMLEAWLGDNIIVECDSICIIRRSPETGDKMVVQNRIML